MCVAVQLAALAVGLRLRQTTSTITALDAHILSSKEVERGLAQRRQGQRKELEQQCA